MSESLQEGRFEFTDSFQRRSVDIDPLQPPQIQASHIIQHQLHHQGKLKFFPGSSKLEAILEHDQTSAPQDPGIHGYENAGMMLSEMFNYAPGVDLLGIPSHLPPKQLGNLANWRNQNLNSSIGHDWYIRQGDGSDNHNPHDEDHENMNNNETNTNHQGNNSINADAAAMQLFLMNPGRDQPSAPMHMLLPADTTPDTNQLQHLHPGGFSAFAANTANIIPAVQLQQMNWAGTAGSAGKLRNWGVTDGVTKITENQGLSLSLSSLQHLEAAMQSGGEEAAGKGEEMRMDGVVYYPPHGHKSGLYSMKAGIAVNSAIGSAGSGVAAGMPGQHSLQVHLGSGTMASVPTHSTMILRNSKYLRAAQELLEEFCSVGRGQMKGRRLGKQESAKCPSTDTSRDTDNPSSSHPSLSPSDRFEHQRKKTKLLSMLDEVDRRYNHYGEQMQLVVNAFDSVLGMGSALPYTSLAQKAMSRHFRCLRDAIVSQLRTTSKLLGEKDVSGVSGITKGETPRLRMLEQSLRQQRAFHGMMMAEQEAWRPQRGLPERSVNILRAWLFEHFLHPYPSDADKQLLARQTGLSRNKVANWFINARVRLWKPMVEEMYQEEAKEEGSESTAAATSGGKRSEVNIAAEKAQTSNPSAEQTKINKQHPNLAANAASYNTNSGQNNVGNLPLDHDTTQPQISHTAPLSEDPDSSFDLISSRMLVDGRSLPVGFGSNRLYHGRDLSHISLTLGLRHAGGLPEQSQQQGRFKQGESQLLRDFAG